MKYSTSSFRSIFGLVWPQSILNTGSDRLRLKDVLLIVVTLSIIVPMAMIHGSPLASRLKEPVALPLPPIVT